MPRKPLPYRCADCGRKVETVYFAPCCGAEICERCKMEDLNIKWFLGKYKCKKCRKARRG